MSSDKNTNTDNADKLVTIATYARQCGVSVGAIYARLDKNDPDHLQLSKVPGVEGVFINTKRYPPQKFKPGWKKGKKRNKEEQPVEQEKTVDIDHYLKITIDLAQDHIKDISDPKEKMNAFAKFMEERHKGIQDQLSFEEFCTRIKNFK